MATAVGLGFAYQLAYRVQSQSDVHATPLAVDSCYERMADGTLRLLPEPTHALAPFNQYALAAHVLRDLLAIVNDHLPGLMWQTALTGITDALNAMRASDPTRSDDPPSQLADAAGPL